MPAPTTSVLSFENDYGEGAHPAILEALSAGNLMPRTGYGTDDTCRSATERIRRWIEQPHAYVRFLVGGTQANQTIIDAIAPPFGAVVAVASAHVNTHEAGAIEASGHKVITLPEHDGKMDPDDLESLCDVFDADDNNEHMAVPSCVYISQSTEYGTLYGLDEMERLSRVCRTHHLPLVVDGARLGYALAATGCDMTAADIARLADAFTIGGTKVGALFGEAAVFPHGAPVNRMTALIKRHGALLAKGWLLGTQFDVLLDDGLYLDIAGNADRQADTIRKALTDKGYEIMHPSSTNQIFVALDGPTVSHLTAQVRLGFMEVLADGRSLMRICTSWATTDDQTRRLIDLL
ncbi:aminotransferase class I/II-fold pyridoxal phosphate-dependent enzyme [uncultured Bifidobacterium sp.]|uniref:threonine aldolase family protein n=1 Tax=uncultured Bifidobacterium sp. TaxID=165187 RepID=UPI002606D412|nr:aminotransferase class I/II-fold pyridoxal phosphate-dependent enzyme [uncultured Bifidobacterium sp.]